MNNLTDYLFNESLKKQKILDILEGCTDYFTGSCLACNENMTKVTRLDNMLICEECISKVYESVKYVGSIENLNLETIQEILLEYVIYLDMVKLQADADRLHNGNIMDLLDTYNIGSTNAIFGDRIDFKNSAVRGKKSKMNRFMIDYNGEFRTASGALRMTPDQDGTVAPLKVRGRGVIDPNDPKGTAGQILKHPTNTAKTSKGSAKLPKTINTSTATNVGTPTPATQTKVNTKYSVGYEFEYYLGKDTIKCKITAEDKAKYIVRVDGIYGAGSKDYSVNNSTTKIEKDFLGTIVSDIRVHTDRKVFYKDTRNVHGLEIEVALNPLDLLDDNGEIEYEMTVLNNSFVNLKNKSLKVKDAFAFSQTVSDHILMSLLAQKVIPDKPFITDAIGDMIYKAIFDSVENLFFVFRVDVHPKFGTSKMIRVDFKANKDWEHGVKLEVEKNLENIVKGFKNIYKFSVKNPADNTMIPVQAELVKGSTLASKITYEVTSAGSVRFDEIYAYDEILDLEAQLFASVSKDIYNILSVTGDIVSATKDKILSTKASASKEKLLNTISKYIFRKMFKGDRELVVIVSEVKIENRDIKGFYLVVTDTNTAPDTMSIKAYYKNFVKSATKYIKVKHDIIDQGVDNSGRAFVSVYLTDDATIKEIIKTLKLNEAYNLDKLNNVSKLFETLKRR